ncbi:MAG: tetratricopeptide repeat protein [Gemmatimonadales bacterium]
MKVYTTRDVAELLGMTEPQVRAQARAGFLRPARGPRRSYRFSFQDLILLRTARALTRARVPMRRVRRELRRLVQQLPAGRSLSEIRITVEGERVVVHDNGSAWNPTSGQLILDFPVARLAARVRPLARKAARTARREDQLTADQWYDLAIDLEAAAPDDARDAYQRALALDPRHADAHVNLGRLLYEASEVQEAAEHFRRALSLRRTHATAAFNLGIALEDLGRPREAVEAYRRALAADPFLADAHFNLSRLYEKAGRRSAAIRHLKAYRELAHAGKA